ncbi:MAG TPA: hypothetical protein VM032_02515 [Vicinamibacterales bacterium]|nr:hypothetical protein [Vicinamibacterales bacterium]
MAEARRYQAGQSLEDFCRACKTDRMHTIIAVDTGGLPLRVVCGYCNSEHQYRGGPRVGVQESPPVAGERRDATAPYRSRAVNGMALPVVNARERTGPAMAIPDRTDDLELLLRRIVREEAGVTPVVPAEKWRGGTLVLRPATPGLQEKTVPIDTLFHKIVMIRNRIRTLEQQVNASELPDDTKIKIQSYITGCYGSLTTFNVLFADEEDQFSGAGGGD